MPKLIGPSLDVLKEMALDAVDREVFVPNPAKAAMHATKYAEARAYLDHAIQPRYLIQEAKDRGCTLDELVQRVVALKDADFEQDRARLRVKTAVRACASVDEVMAIVRAGKLQLIAPGQGILP